MIAAADLARIAAGFALGALPAGAASVGTGIQGNPVCLPVTAQPGHSYPLGTVYVADTGSGTEDITLTAQPVWKGQEMYGRAIPVPPSWVSVSYPSTLWIIHHSSVQVGAGQGAYLSVTLNVPAAALRGMYAGNLVAGAGGTPSAGNGTQAALGAAAATDLEFAVGVKAPACGQVTAPSPSVIAASQRAAAAGDFSAASPSASPSSKPPPVTGYAILAVIAVILLAGLRKALSR